MEWGAKGQKDHLSFGSRDERGGEEGCMRDEQSGFCLVLTFFLGRGVRREPEPFWSHSEWRRNWWQKQPWCSHSAVHCGHWRFPCGFLRPTWHSWEDCSLLISMCLSAHRFIFMNWLYLFELPQIQGCIYAPSYLYFPKAKQRGQQSWFQKVAGFLFTTPVQVCYFPIQPREVQWVGGKY